MFTTFGGVAIGFAPPKRSHVRSHTTDLLKQD